MSHTNYIILLWYMLCCIQYAIYHVDHCDRYNIKNNIIDLNTIAMIGSLSTSWESKEFGLTHEQQKSGSRTGTGTWSLARSCQIGQIQGQTHWHWPNGSPINCWYGVSHFWCILPERITNWSQVCYQWFTFALLNCIQIEWPKLTNPSAEVASLWLCGWECHTSTTTTCMNLKDLTLVVSYVGSWNPKHVIDKNKPPPSGCPGVGRGRWLFRGRCYLQGI